MLMKLLEHRDLTGLRKEDEEAGDTIGESRGLRPGSFNKVKEQ